jgi:inhibitor of cysteine peptidase
MQAGTGFSWEVSKNDAALMEMKAKPSIERMGDKPGGAQLQVFRFQAKAAGKNDLELIYRRPFEKDKEPARTFKLTIQIVDVAKCKKDSSSEAP